MRSAERTKVREMRKRRVCDRRNRTWRSDRRHGEVVAHVSYKEWMIMYLMSVCVVQRIASDGYDDDPPHIKPDERSYICLTHT
jgi:hypothetical protein